MPTTTIENLPNVCIRNITLDNNKAQGSQCTITVDIVVKGGDSDNSEINWYDDDFLLKHLSLIVVKSDNDIFNRLLSSGQIMINSSTISTYSTPSSQIQLKQIPLLQKAKLLRQENDRGENECLVTLQFFQSNGDANNVDIYAMTSVNMVDISNSYGIDLKSQHLSTYCGPIISESVFKDGLVVTQSNLLRLPTGDVYYGPTHYHPDTGYMVGSKHTTQPHSLLTIESVPNTKLKDNRRVNYPSNNQSNEIIKGTSIISSLDTSMNSSQIMNAVFSIDFNKILLTRSKYGRLFFNLREEIYNQMLTNFKIKHIKVYKKKIKQFKNNKKPSKYISRELLIDSKDATNTVGFLDRVKISAKTQQGQNHIAHVLTSKFDLTVAELDVLGDFDETRPVSAIREEHLNISSYSSANYVRTFSITDGEPKTKFDDKYVYELDVSLYDPSIATLQNIMTEIEDSIASLDRYINTSISRKNYDFTSKRLKQSYIDFVTANYEEASEYPWIKAVTVYGKYYSLMNNISITEQSKIVNKYYKFLNLSSFDVRSSKSFLSKFKEFSCSFMQYFKISNKKMHNLVSGNSQSIYQNVNFTDIEISHEFSEVLDYTKNKSGFEYLLSNNMPESIISRGENNVITMTKQEYLDRIQLEMERFPVKSMNMESSVSYLSPVLFHNKQKIHDLQQGNAVTYKEMFHEIESDTESNTSPPFQTTQTYGGHSPSYDAVTTHMTVQDISYIRASRYIGSRYGQVESSDSDEEYPQSVFGQSSANIQQTILNVNYDYEPEDFDPTATTSSDSPVQERYFQDTLGKTLQTPTNKNLFRILFFSIHQVQYKMPYGGQSSSMKSNNWKTLTLTDFNSLQGDIMCKLQPVSSLFYPKGSPLSYRAYNRIFVIRFPSESATDPALASISSQLVSTDSSSGLQDNDFLISNIITQPEFRTGANVDLDYSQTTTQAQTSGMPSTSSQTTEPIVVESGTQPMSPSMPTGGSNGY